MLAEPQDADEEKPSRTRGDLNRARRTNERLREEWDRLKRS